MSFKEGKFYAIQGKDQMGRWMFLESLNSTEQNRIRLRSIARRTTKNYANSWDEDDEYRPANEATINVSENPFSIRLFEIPADIQSIMSNMRSIRKNCGPVGVDANSLRLVVVESNVTAFVPESQSQEEIELRKFALDKLSENEKSLLKVGHWEVYHKLGDRSMLDDEEDDNG